MKKLFFILTTILTFNLSAFENGDYSITGPGIWSTNKSLFGADVIFMPPLSEQDNTSMLYIKTYPTKILTQNIYSFLKNDLTTQTENSQKPISNIKIIREATLKTASGKIKYIETTYNEAHISERQHSVYAIMPHKNKYIYFNFSTAHKTFPKNWSLVKKSFLSFRLK